ncbi:MAG TPA: hypothetical protein DCS93_24695 [Microscillaceae bacterium]|nr:hypothetical protein [Microscillaceae bacterium]
MKNWILALLIICFCQLGYTQTLGVFWDFAVAGSIDYKTQRDLAGALISQVSKCEDYAFKYVNSVERSPSRISEIRDILLDLRKVYDAPKRTSKKLLKQVANFGKKHQCKVAVVGKVTYDRTKRNTDNAYKIYFAFIDMATLTHIHSDLLFFSQEQVKNISYVEEDFALSLKKLCPNIVVPKVKKIDPGQLTNKEIEEVNQQMRKVAAQEWRYLDAGEVRVDIPEMFQQYYYQEKIIYFNNGGNELLKSEVRSPQLTKKIIKVLRILIKTTNYLMTILDNRGKNTQDLRRNISFYEEFIGKLNSLRRE